MYCFLHISRPVFRIFSLRLFSGLLFLKSSLFVFKRCSLLICFLLESLIFLGLAKPLFLRLLLCSLLCTLFRLFLGFTFFYRRLLCLFDVSFCVLLIIGVNSPFTLVFQLVLQVKWLVYFKCIFISVRVCKTISWTGISK